LSYLKNLLACTMQGVEGRNKLFERPVHRPLQQHESGNGISIRRIFCGSNDFSEQKAIRNKTLSDVAKLMTAHKLQLTHKQVGITDLPDCRPSRARFLYPISA